MPLACMRLPVPKSLLLKSRSRGQGSFFGALGLELRGFGFREWGFAVLPIMKKRLGPEFFFIRVDIGFRV